MPRQVPLPHLKRTDQEAPIEEGMKGPLTDFLQEPVASTYSESILNIDLQHAMKCGITLTFWVAAGLAEGQS